jgi:hypothetical protein
MGRRSGFPETDDDVAFLTLTQLNRRIGVLAWRVGSGPSSALRKSAFKKLVWLEARREILHGVKAPERKF